MVPSTSSQKKAGQVNFSHARPKLVGIKYAKEIIKFVKIRFKVGHSSEDETNRRSGNSRNKNAQIDRLDSTQVRSMNSESVRSNAT